ncbi:MAG: Glutamine synthetase [Firmicutes bacterium ADurb.Bin182]|nr:MAG: Glutamine synthetase [Firmicutes bacterium ADurb.Bin182]
MKSMDALEQFGCNVFSDETMRERLSPETYSALKHTVEMGGELTIEIANAVAAAMCEWARERGATHYTHWFQPMTGSTAEKHDAFLAPGPFGQRPLISFSGKALIKGEADGSSLPSGGLRATFEARGYTTWDCTSPAFVKTDYDGTGVLCIPTAFCSFYGDALDEKTPLLRSMECLSKQAVRVLRHLGFDDVKRVTPTAGAEQEYFLIDKSHFLKRKDLVYTGRTLFGAAPAKGQELFDQYYAAMPEKVSAFMNELNAELWKLGVPAKTNHNEVAPSQYELAVMYSSSNVAADYNQIVMEQMRRVADRHGMTCLLHEKPFANINGSGKHNNWSLVTDTGKNLLKPGKDEIGRRVFLTFLIAILAAVDEYAEALITSCATPGNLHRLGSHEAPPRIISVFTGDRILSEIEAFTNGSLSEVRHKEHMTMGVSTLAVLYKDEADRNRTSPFAFTGDKFEFRMCGSSQSAGFPNTVLNTVASESLKRIADALDEADDKMAALPKLLGEMMKKHGRIVFNGNNYSGEWAEEAKRRGLPCVKSTVEAIEALQDPKIVDLFARHDVLSESELSGRKEVYLDSFNHIIHIEAVAMLKISRQKIMPACVRYSLTLSSAINEAVKAGIEPASIKELLIKLNTCMSAFSGSIETLSRALEETCHADASERAHALQEKVLPAMERVRHAADALELIVDKEYWPLPSYGEILFHIN